MSHLGQIYVACCGIHKTRHLDTTHLPVVGDTCICWFLSRLPLIDTFSKKKNRTLFYDRLPLLDTFNKKNRILFYE
jgi:hypothetical protein